MTVNDVQNTIIILKERNGNDMENLDENTVKEEKIDIENPQAEYYERKRWLFFGLPFTFTKYYIKHDLITRDTGFFNKKEDDCSSTNSFFF